MIIHELKIWPEYFLPIIKCEKTFEIRTNADRKFTPGDRLVLKEWNPKTEQFTGRECSVEVGYTLTNPPMLKGFTIMSIKFDEWWTTDTFQAQNCKEQCIEEFEDEDGMGTFICDRPQGHGGLHESASWQRSGEAPLRTQVANEVRK